MREAVTTMQFSIQMRQMVDTVSKLLASNGRPPNTRIFAKPGEPKGGMQVDLPRYWAAKARTCLVNSIYFRALCLK
jgi:hypothetical protein